MDGDLSLAAVEFLAEIRRVCERHGLALAPTAYDGLEVWPLEPGEDALQFPSIEEK